jgi:lauroyl/myristoyl acyltransferase
MKAIFDNLKENRVVITQCDEIDEWKPCRHNKIDFLGKHIHMDKTINILLKRCKAAIVFGAMHRDSRHRYKFITSSWEEMTKQYQRSMDMSIGAVVLKFMEHYIYKFPEEWYQWKKYPKLDMFAPSDVAAETPASIPVLEPSLV